jgi:hypothetical protein
MVGQTMKVMIALLATGLATSSHLSDRRVTALPPLPTLMISESLHIAANNTEDINAGINGKSTTTSAHANAPKLISTGNPLWAIPLSKLSETRERPLFTPSRLPPPPLIATPPNEGLSHKSEKETIPQFALVGTIISDVQAFGLFIDPANNTLIRLKIGSEYQGWVLHSVQKREAVLKKDDLSATLSLQRHEL